MARVLENLGTLFKELGQFENLQEHTHIPSTSPHSSHHTETLPSSDNNREMQELEGRDFSATETQEPEANTRDIASLGQNPDSIEEPGVNLGDTTPLEQKPDNDEETEANSRDATLLEPNPNNVDESEANSGDKVLLEREPDDFETAPIF